MTDESITPNFVVVTRLQARSEGKKRYFTGKCCPHGHIAERMVSSTACVECLKIRRQNNGEAAYAAVKRWRARNHGNGKRTEEARKRREKYPEKVAASSKRWRERHIETLRPLEAEYARKRRKADPEGNRRRIKAFKERQELSLTEIAGRPRASICEVCKEKGKTVFDHCHNSGEFRGWICDRCNKTLGMVKDSPSILRKMAKYLEGHDVKTNFEGKKCAASQRFWRTAPEFSFER